MTHNDYLDLTEAAKRTPGRPNPSTVWRWCRKGILSRSGGRIRLHHVRAGCRIYIKADDLDDFFKRTAEADAPHFEQESQPKAVTKPRSNTKREKSVAAAKKVFEAVGS